MIYIVKNRNPFNKKGNNYTMTPWVNFLQRCQCCLECQKYWCCKMYGFFWPSTFSSIAQQNLIIKLKIRFWCSWQQFRSSKSLNYFHWILSQPTKFLYKELQYYKTWYLYIFFIYHINVVTKKPKFPGILFNQH